MKNLIIFFFLGLFTLSSFSLTAQCSEVDVLLRDFEKLCKKYVTTDAGDDNYKFLDDFKIIGAGSYYRMDISSKNKWNMSLKNFKEQPITKMYSRSSPYTIPVVSNPRFLSLVKKDFSKYVKAKISKQIVSEIRIINSSIKKLESFTTASFRTPDEFKKKRFAESSKINKAYLSAQRKIKLVRFDNSDPLKLKIKEYQRKNCNFQSAQLSASLSKNTITGSTPVSLSVTVNKKFVNQAHLNEFVYYTVNNSSRKNKLKWSSNGAHKAQLSLAGIRNGENKIKVYLKKNLKDSNPMSKELVLKKSSGISTTSTAEITKVEINGKEHNSGAIDISESNEFRVEIYFDKKINIQEINRAVDIRYAGESQRLSDPGQVPSIGRYTAAVNIKAVNGSKPLVIKYKGEIIQRFIRFIEKGCAEQLEYYQKALNELSTIEMRLDKQVELLNDVTKFTDEFNNKGTWEGLVLENDFLSYLLIGTGAAGISATDYLKSLLYSKMKTLIKVAYLAEPLAKLVSYAENIQRVSADDDIKLVRGISGLTKIAVDDMLKAKKITEEMSKDLFKSLNAANEILRGIEALSKGKKAFDYKAKEYEDLKTVIKVESSKLKSNYTKYSQKLANYKRQRKILESRVNDLNAVLKQDCKMNWLDKLTMSNLKPFVIEPLPCIAYPEIKQVFDVKSLPFTATGNLKCNPTNLKLIAEFAGLNPMKEAFEIKTVGQQFMVKIKSLPDDGNVDRYTVRLTYEGFKGGVSTFDIENSIPLDDKQVDNSASNNKIETNNSSTTNSYNNNTQSTNSNISNNTTTMTNSGTINNPTTTNTNTNSSSTQSTSNPTSSKPRRSYGVYEVDSDLNAGENSYVILDINSPNYDPSRLFIRYNNQTVRKSQIEMLPDGTVKITGHMKETNTFYVQSKAPIGKVTIKRKSNRTSSTNGVSKTTGNVRNSTNTHNAQSNSKNNSSKGAVSEFESDLNAGENSYVILEINNPSFIPQRFTIRHNNREVDKSQIELLSDNKIKVTKKMSPVNTFIIYSRGLIGRVTIQ